MIMDKKENETKTKNNQNRINKEENISQEKEDVIHILKEKYKQSKYEFKDFSKKTKDNIKKNPYQFITIAAALGTILGIGIGIKIYNNIQNKNDFGRYKKNILKNQNFENFYKNLKNDIRKKPYESTTLALGVGTLIGIIIKSLKGCLKK